jgi:ribosomal protein S18 acetylase RimI-like enzyme
MSTALGYRYALALIDWFRRYDGAVALAAVAGDVPAGYVLVVNSADLYRLYRSLLPAVIGCGLVRPWIMADSEIRQMARWRRRLLLGLRPQAPRPPSTMTLKTLAVATPWQSRGVGGELLAAFTAEARKREARTLTLSVARTNTSARAFYAHRGWRLFSEGDGKFVDYGVEIG